MLAPNRSVLDMQWDIKSVLKDMTSFISIFSVQLIIPSQFTSIYFTFYRIFDVR